jgi:hypothetical protein
MFTICIIGLVLAVVTFLLLLRKATQKVVDISKPVIIYPDETIKE